MTLSGCNVTLFSDCRKVAGRFCLEKWEDNQTFYLDGPFERNGGGYLGGAVSSIGWNGQYIIAERQANVGSDGDGWMVVDIRDETMTGPFSKDQILRKRESQGAIFHTAAVAWKNLN